MLLASTFVRHGNALAAWSALPILLVLQRLGAATWLRIAPPVWLGRISCSLDRGHPLVVMAFLQHFVGQTPAAPMIAVAVGAALLAAAAMHVSRGMPAQVLCRRVAVSSAGAPLRTASRATAALKVLARSDEPGLRRAACHRRSPPQKARSATKHAATALATHRKRRRVMLKGGLLWLLGIPIPILIVLWLVGVL